MTCGIISSENTQSLNKKQPTRLDSRWVIGDDFRRTQDRQCTCNITLRRVRVTIIAVEKRQALHILRVCL